jgi:hypothetical protein
MYILTEQIMNGTVTMQIISTGVEAETFEDAIIKIKNLPNFPIMTIQKENNSEFSYYISGQFPCFGRMENKILRVI